MRLVQEHHGIFGQVVCQRRRRVAGRRAREVPGVVFNAFAVTQFTEHFQIKPSALFQPLRLHQLALAHEHFQPIREFHLDGFHSRQHLIARRHIVAARIDGEAWNLLPYASGQRVEQLQRFDLVIEKLDADRHFTVFRRENVDGIAAHPKRTPRKLHVIALVLHADQLGYHVALPHPVAGSQRHDHLVVCLRLTDAVNGRDRRDDDHIAPLENALGARQAHLFDVLVDRRVLLDEQVALRDIGLGLVVVVIADEILHRIVREELPELAVKLGCQGLVGGEHNGRATQAGDHIGHRERLARAGHAQKGLEHLAI